MSICYNKKIQNIKYKVINKTIENMYKIIFYK